ncbi:MAG: N-acetylmuramoyl-L-alanine amidase [Leeuwenhoekiella sp.]
MRSKTFYIVLAFATILTTAFLPVDYNKDKFIVVLDAGHGGDDPGKDPPTGLQEKDIALKIVLDVGKELEKNPDIKVVYTRKTDVFINLWERGRIANRAGADLFVSVHCNAHNSQASGAETYVLSGRGSKINAEVAKTENSVIFLEDNYEEKYSQYNLNNPESMIGVTLIQEEFLDQSIAVASYIQDNFTKKLKRKDRSVKQAAFVVLHQTVMPSVLVETGFVTNTAEGKYLNSAKGQKELAGAIADAVIKYKENMETMASSMGIDEVIPVVETEDIIVPDVTFKVQIAASGKSIDTAPYNFKGLREVSKTKEKGLFKYFYGSTSNYSEIQQKLKEARGKGYTTAFVVSYKNGVKVPVDKILK